jgi:exosortase
LNTSQSPLGIHLQKHQLFYILLAILILSNFQILIRLAQDWYTDGNYSHGFLVIPISIFLFYRRRHELTFPAPNAWLGFALFIVGTIGIIFGIAASEFFSTRISLVLALTGISLFYFGWNNFRKVWFAYFFLLFMIPVPAIIYYSATLPMQLFASKVTNVILQIIGVPSYREGNIIHLPSYALEVSEACSGLRSLVTLLALSSLFGYLTLPGKIRPLILFFSAIPIAIVVNIFRLLLTGIGAYAISTKIAEDFLHQLSGILVFILAILLLMLISGLLRWKRNRLL